MVLSPALLFLGARQFRVSMHTVSEGLAVLGQGACSLRALLEVVGRGPCLQRPRLSPASCGHRPAPGRFQHQPVARVAEEQDATTTPGSDLHVPQNPGSLSRVSSPESLPCEPGSSL